MSIPIIRVYPNGRSGITEAHRPDAIQAAANRFIAHGGRYMVAKMSETEVRLMAGLRSRDGKLIEAATETVPNGLELLDAIDRLVSKSVRRLDDVQ